MPAATHRPLGFADLFVLAVIFFGQASIASLRMFLEMPPEPAAATVAVREFDEMENYATIAFELASLAVAALYLRWRRFDFRQLDFSLTRHTLPQALLLVLLAGLLADLAHLSLGLWQPLPGGEAAAGNDAANAPPLSLSLLLLAFVNGFYEELFFIGLVFALPRRHWPLAIAFSLGVRFVFHTYQGLAGALVITTLGVVFALARYRLAYLWPFMLAHAVFDVFGLSLSGLLLRILPV